jgi:hypothetical protein
MPQHAQAPGGAVEILGAMRMTTGETGSQTKIPFFLKEKTHLSFAATRDIRVSSVGSEDI